MASHRRILNQSTKMYTDYDTAVQMVEDWCACRWVDNQTIESLSGEEQRLAKLKRAADTERVPYSELHGVIRVGPHNPDSRGLSSVTRWFFETAIPRKQKIRAELCAQ